MRGPVFDDFQLIEPKQDLYGRRIRYEEALLVKSLPGYAAYTSRTHKLLPGVF
jgi:hypothetical protein